MSGFGGYGQVSYGRSGYGSPSPQLGISVEPRFSQSRPRDGSVNVPKNSRVSFEVYYYETSQPPPVEHIHWGFVPNILVELSLDSGNTFFTVFDPNTMITDYPGYVVTASYKTSQIARCVITSLGDWPDPVKVIIRYTGPDEFGQDATKQPPVIWG